jgi:hypothetical protein
MEDLSILSSDERHGHPFPTDDDHALVARLPAALRTEDRLVKHGKGAALVHVQTEKPCLASDPVGVVKVQAFRDQGSISAHDYCFLSTVCDQHRSST